MLTQALNRAAFGPLLTRPVSSKLEGLTVAICLKSPARHASGSASKPSEKESIRYVARDKRTRAPASDLFTSENSYALSVTADASRMAQQTTPTPATTISTLVPGQVQRTDLLDLDGREDIFVTFAHSKAVVRIQYFTARNGQAVPFPSGSRGFLYYDTKTSSVRLRVKRDAATPRDLLLPNGNPWRIPLTVIKRKNSKYPGFREQLERDTFLTTQLGPSTFNPDLLRPEDLIVINRKSIRFLLPGPPDKPFEKVKLLYTRDYSPFPIGESGFLYYHAGSPNAPLGGSLRFRLARNLSEFDQQKDLLLPSGLPWSVLLAQMVTTAPYRPILEELLRTGLVTPQSVEYLRKAYRPGERVAERTLFELGQPFLVDFATTSMSLTVVDPRGETATVIIRNAFASGNHMSNHMYDNGAKCAFTGTALARLERAAADQSHVPRESRLPKISLKRKSIHLRIVKIVDPVRCVVPGYRAEDFGRGVLEPREGELLSVCKDEGRGPWVEPWEMDLDLMALAGLGLLWDT